MCIRDRPRIMETREMPIRAAVFGRCYRKDEVDATHSPMFHQMEGVVVDKHITFADLKGLLHSMAVQMYGPDTVTRFRPDQKSTRLNSSHLKLSRMPSSA